MRGRVECVHIAYIAHAPADVTMHHALLAVRLQERLRKEEQLAQLQQDIDRQNDERQHWQVL